MSAVRISTVRDPAAMPEPLRGRLFEETTRVVAASLAPGQPEDENWAADFWRSRWPEFQGSELVLARSGDRLVGFVSYRFVEFEELRFLNLLAGCVEPDWQSQGIAFSMNLRIFFRALGVFRFRRFYLICRILNAYAFYGWAKEVGEPQAVWPDVSGLHRSRPLEEVARRFVNRFDAGDRYDSQTGVSRGRTPAGARPHTPSGHPDVDRYFDQLDLDQGDMLVAVMRIDLPIILRRFSRLLRALPRGFLPRLRPAAAGEAG